MKISAEKISIRVISARIVILLAVFYLGFSFGQSGANSISEKNIESDSALCAIDESSFEISKQASLMIDFGNGSLKVFNDVDINSDSTVFSLLSEILEINNLEFKYKDYGGELGVMIEAINGEASNLSEMKYWQYWVNNKYAKVGASLQPVNAGDVIEWKLIKGQFNE